MRADVEGGDASIPPLHVCPALAPTQVKAHAGAGELAFDFQGVDEVCCERIVCFAVVFFDTAGIAQVC
jgi:hypothetical protein